MSVYLSMRLNCNGFLQVLVFMFVLAAGEQMNSFYSMNNVELETGKPIYGFKNYTKYVPGNSTIVVTAPHGGGLRPSHLTSRPPQGCWDESTQSCIYRFNCTGPRDKKCRCALVTDFNTLKLAEDLVDRLHELTGQRPHFVASLLHRSFFDPNREIEQAAFGVPEVKQAWYDYHERFIQQAKKAASGYGKGLAVLFDIHGQSHRENWVEVGFAIGRHTLNVVDKPLDLHNGSASTIGHLARKMNSSQSFDEAIRGKSSLGGRLEKRGVKSVPSPTNRGPGDGGYYNGGYTVRRHGGGNGGDNSGFPTDAIQIESPRTLRDKIKIDDYSRRLSESINEFVKEYYGSVVPESSSSLNIGSRHQTAKSLKWLLCIITASVAQKFKMCSNF